MEPPKPTIQVVFAEFIEDRGQRLSERTMAKYRAIVDLYRSDLESYWPGHHHEYDRVTKAGGTSRGAFGPEEISSGFNEFLGYFMPRKVIAGKKTMRAAGTVLKKLAQWLVPRHEKKRRYRHCERRRREAIQK